MRRIELLWKDQTIEHLWASHHVTPDEVDEALFGVDDEDAYCVTYRDGQCHIFLGQTGDGRLLIMAGEFVTSEKLRVFSARDMNPQQKRRYRR